MQFLKDKNGKKIKPGCFVMQKRPGVKPSKRKIMPGEIVGHDFVFGSPGGIYVARVIFSILSGTYPFNDYESILYNPDPQKWEVVYDPSIFANKKPSMVMEDCWFFEETVKYKKNMDS